MADRSIPPSEDARFGPLKAMTEAHWRDHRKKTVHMLEVNQELKQQLDHAVENAIFIMNQAAACGLAPDQARELAYDVLLQPEDET